MSAMKVFSGLHGCTVEHRADVAAPLRTQVEDAGAVVEAEGRAETGSRAAGVRGVENRSNSLTKTLPTRGF
jgi:NADH dehydrogenase/NADH:ubiquinone oxidoreductase subunit G